MSDIQTLTAAIEELKGQFATSIAILAESVALLETQTRDEEVKEQTALKFVEFFGEELAKYVPCGKVFAGRLNQIRQNFDQFSYASLAGVYYDLVDKPSKGWAQRRQVLLTASAIWRYTFHGRDSKLRSQIEAAIACSDCGGFAQTMVDRMVREGLWR